LDTDGIPLITKLAYKKARYIIQLVESLELKEDMFVNEDIKNYNQEAAELQDDDDDEESQTGDSQAPATLAALIRTCSRLQSQLSSLETLKHGGLSRLEMCRIVLKILKLLTATYTIEVNEKNERKATIHYENVGCICTPETNEEDIIFESAADSKTLEEELKNRFALPSPAREVLLSMTVNILSNKGPLRSVSNAAIYPDTDDSSRFLLIIHWKALLRTLLRTAPYLDEHKVGHPPMASNSRQNTIVKRTVQMIRDARHFFDQGLRPNKVSMIDDRTALQIWEMVKTDVMYHSHTHACYRSLVFLYLFQPSRCTSDYYVKQMPLWFKSWTNIDRCPEIDFLWLALFCRARKHLPADYDWGSIRRRLLTHSQYWLQLPIGGASLDKRFPNASAPRSRTCPSRLKVFAGVSSSYEEGIDFVAKVAKLLVIGLGTGKPVDGVSEGSRDVLRFLSFITPYFNPSNIGSWTFTLGAFLHYFCYELCCRVGTAGSMEAMKVSNFDLAKALFDVEPCLTSSSLPPNEIVLLMNALLPLCQQALYSKNGHVGRAGEAAMLYLTQIDPARVTPAFIDFATRALDITAVNLAHQAPAALSALTRLLQPALRSSPKILLVRLPDILRLTLAGIDSNDQNKTIRTLILYRSLTSWIPVGGSPQKWRKTGDKSRDLEDKSDGTMGIGKDLLNHLYVPTRSPQYLEALEKLPANSLLKQREDLSDFDFGLLVDEAASALSDWVLEFLDRIYSLLRASGEREKAGKTASGVASRHSSADVQQARNFSRVLKECLTQTFASMDDEVHKSAVKSVARFLEEETLPSAAKDASYLCLAVSAARIQNEDVVSPGLDDLLPVLLDDLEHHSNKTVAYRLRCLSGAVRSCGIAINKHKNGIMRALGFALSSTDKHVYKTGCKLLRHTLATLSESYALACDSVPRNISVDTGVILGRSSQLNEDPVQWHVPDSACIQFASDILKRHVFGKIANLSSASADSMEVDVFVEGAYKVDIPELRRCLRVVRYALRGGAGVMLDCDTGEGLINNDGVFSGDERRDLTLVPYEKAIHNLLKAASEETLKPMLQMRGRLCSFIVSLSSLIASETFKLQEISNSNEGTAPSSAGDAQTSDRKYQGLISSDSKVCKEASDISLLLLTRRGASFRSQEGKTIWKAQKQLATDFALLAQADHMAESLQRAQLYCSSSTVFFKDGEDAGKTLPRRLLVIRIQLFHDSLQRMASFEVPRRLRRLFLAQKSKRTIQFSTQRNFKDLTGTASGILQNTIPSSLDGYEGIMDGLFSLCCHSNTQVRASAIGVVDYAITRYGWLLAPRVPRLMAAVNLKDDQMHGKFGIPSCSALTSQIDGQGKRKRLAEAMKGVCSLIAIPRAGKQLLGSEKSRSEFVQTICGTEDLISMMPAEEMQKMVHYLHSLFSPFRLKFYSLPRSSGLDHKKHQDCLLYLLNILSTEKQNTDSDEAGEAKAVHWRKLLHACWFLTVFVDRDDLDSPDPSVHDRLWKICFQIIEDEYGQPLQRVALGLFGRLVMMIRNDKDRELLRDRFLTESFSRSFGNALVYDHKEDSSVGGGHDAQWATGVADMIRDSARNVAPRSLFPFQRTNQSSGTFKVSHAQLVEQILLGLVKADALVVARHLLSFSKDMAGSPPSEDQRNQQCTSAEIFAGVCRALLQFLSGQSLNDIWESDLLPFMDEVISKIPNSLSGAYFDSVRYAIQFSPPNKFYPMTCWLFGKIEGSLWEPRKGVQEDESMGESGDSQGKNGAQGTDGFTAQSKWLYLCCALLVELDDTEVDGALSKVPWYTGFLTKNVLSMDTDLQTVEDLKKSWQLVHDKLLPRLIQALGHPYESCRDHIAGCLFRICYCHRKMSKNNASSSGPETEDPGTVIVHKLLALQESNDPSFQNRYNSLITARRFFSYCIHFGDAKHEYSDYIIPLLPLAFQALNSNVEEGGEIAEAAAVANRALESEVVKGYRYTIAEVSVASVLSYGGNEDISRILITVEQMSKHENWQVRHACANFLRCFQGSHKFLFTEEHAEKITSIVAKLLADERREVSSSAMAAITGIIAALPATSVAKLVQKYAKEANRSTMKKRKPSTKIKSKPAPILTEEQKREKELKRAKMQQSSVFVLCAAVLSQPYETPPYVPKALAAISKHSFERNAPLGVRDTVKKCCAEYKRTHMSDNWTVHRQVFTQEELEALEDVVSSPHYYA
jgi:proteasome activator subunit 4